MWLTRPAASTSTQLRLTGVAPSAEPGDAGLDVLPSCAVACFALLTRMKGSGAVFSRSISYLRRHALAATAFTSAILALAGSTYAANQPSGHGTVFGWAVINAKGRLIAGGGGPQPERVQPDGVYAIGWAKPLKGTCATTVSLDVVHNGLGRSTSFTPGSALANSSPKPGVQDAATMVYTFNQHGQATPLGFDVVVIC
jgi:hypothetical protein